MQIRSKNRVYRGILIALMAMVISSSFFWQHRKAVGDSLKFAPLANGWVSHFAALHLSPLSLSEKYRKTIADDLIHGRYRPASHMLTSFSYAVSPILHHRLSDPEESREYRDLVTGDLVILAKTLLLCMVIAVFSIAYTIWKYTGNFALLFIPVLFIPLSPTLTENLVQFHIDSQEIPLLLYVSLWAVLYFVGIVTHKRSARMIFVVFSTLFLLLSFMAKETSIVLLPVMLLLFVYLMILKIAGKSTSDFDKWALFLTGWHFLVSFVCSVNIYLLVIRNKTKYGTGYSTENLVALKKNVLVAWDVLGAFAINQMFCGAIILVAIAVLLFNFKRKIYTIPVAYHIMLLLFLVTTGYAFFLIIVPWEVILAKYLIPAVFFINFALCYSLILIAALLPRKMALAWTVICLAAGGLLFGSLYKKADAGRKYYYELAGYGTKIVRPLLESITEGVKVSPAAQVNIFAEYGTDAAWGAFVPWGKQQLERLLSIEKGFNIVDIQGHALLNTRMPDEELTSYRFNKKHRSVYLTNRREELTDRPFQLVYKGYKKDENAPEYLKFMVNNKEVSYKRSKEKMRYKPGLHLPEFALYKYLPVSD